MKDESEIDGSKSESERYILTQYSTHPPHPTSHPFEEDLASRPLLKMIFSPRFLGIAWD